MNNLQTPRTALRPRFKARAAALAIGLPLMLASAAHADLTVIGTASQTSKQASTMNQNANNQVSVLPIVGINNSVGKQTGTTRLSDSERIPLGATGVLQGKANQSNQQGAAARQLNAGSKTETNNSTAGLTNDQLIGDGGIILADSGQTNDQANAVAQGLVGSKTATANVVAGLGNTQIVGGLNNQVILGTTGQSSNQGDTSAQSVVQKDGSPKVAVNGNSADTKLNSTEKATIGLNNVQGVLTQTIIGTALQGNKQAHDGIQSTSQTPAAIALGNNLTKQTETSGVTVGNCQTVNNTPTSCFRN